MHVTPLHDWVVVRLDSIPSETTGGIILPQGTSGEIRQRTGTVLRSGPGKYTKHGVLEPTGVGPGDRVVFFREHLEHQQGKQMTRIVQDLEENTGMVRAVDILFALEDA